MAPTRTGGKLRIMVGDMAYLKRGLVVRHLEGKGFEIIPSTPSPSELVRVVGIEQPDALLLDTETAEAAGADAVSALRAASPDTKVVLVAPVSADEVRVQGADRVVDAGIELGVISTLLIDLCAEPTIVLPESEVVGGEALAETAPIVVPEAEAGPGATAEAEVEPGAIAEAEVEQGAIAEAEVEQEATSETPPVLIPEAEEERAKRPAAWVASRAMLAVGIGIIAVSIVAGLLSSGEETVAPEATGAPAAGGEVVTSPPGPSALDTAYATLDELTAALQAGRFVEAQVDAQVLMEQRQAALAAGFSLFTLDADITKALQPFAGELTGGQCTILTGILGDLMPACAPTKAGGGGGGGTTFFGGTSTGGTSGGSTAGGGAQTGGGGGGGNVSEETFPGQGAHYGWEHKPPKGGWHGKPPGR